MEKMRIPIGCVSLLLQFDVCDNYRGSHFSVCMTSCCTHFFILEERSNKVMPEYKDLYYKLFNRITDIIEELKELQNQAEEMYINSQKNEKL